VVFVLVVTLVNFRTKLAHVSIVHLVLYHLLLVLVNVIVVHLVHKPQLPVQVFVLLAKLESFQ